MVFAVAVAETHCTSSVPKFQRFVSRVLRRFQHGLELFEARFALKLLGCIMLVLFLLLLLLPSFFRCR